MSERSYGAWLRQKRGVKGRPGFISQKALGDRVGVDRTHIVKIETGVIGMPEDDLRNRIHEVLGTTDADLEEAGVRFPNVVFGETRVNAGVTVSATATTRISAEERYRRLTALLKQVDLGNQRIGDWLEETIRIVVEPTHEPEPRP